MDRWIGQRRMHCDISLGSSTVDFVQTRFLGDVPGSAFAHIVASIHPFPLLQRRTRRLATVDAMTVPLVALPRIFDFLRRLKPGFSAISPHFERGFATP
jgi:hypothetical protein